ncbi:hypothetical protein HPE56_07425 [Maribacter sp. ANRC-HE7]|uniref:Uncharacterized protein n=1 Tax=Maribacter aquimaris TaxID=2737171 RepID=A0ABR7V398_9FLAO|nr:hypothetical protein [Maribacter aquimaris]MBD0777618.1 hypothetical protein [Maribacter aquimaris]
MGFDFENTIFGDAVFDLIVVGNKLDYKDVFDGFVFYEPIEKYDLIDFYTGLVSKDFEGGFFGRYKIFLEYTEDRSKVEKFQNPVFRQMS